MTPRRLSDEAASAGDIASVCPAPQGLVLIVGPDGSGKSTVAEELAALARGAGLRVRHDHYRPGIVRPPAAGAAPVTEPHAQAPRRLTTGIVKLAVVFADTVAGSVGVWRRGRRHGLVIVERGWLDMAVDPRRYRLPARLAWLARAAARLLPKADLVLVLGGEAETIHRRKPEIGAREVARQIERWSELAPRAGRSVLAVDTTTTAASVAAARAWDDLGRRRPLRWRSVPLTSARSGLRTAGWVPRRAWIHRSYRTIPRLLDPVRPILARLGRLDRVVDPTLRHVEELCRQLEIEPSGLLAMRSSTAGRWVVGIAEDGDLRAVIKVGGAADGRLRAEGEVLAALAPEAGRLGAPELLWTGRIGDAEAVVTRAVRLVRGGAEPSLDDVEALCTALVRGAPGRPPLVHGDLTPWNIASTVDGLRIFDWEYATWDAAPMHDLAHYVVQSGALLGRHRPAEVVTLLTEEGGLGWRHLERCGVDPRRAAELVRTYLARAPQFGRKSMRFREEVGRWLP